MNPNWRDLSSLTVRSIGQRFDLATAKSHCSFESSRNKAMLETMAEKDMSINQGTGYISLFDFHQPVTSKAIVLEDMCLSPS